jgi:hypothetical protein
MTDDLIRNAQTMKEEEEQQTETIRKALIAACEEQLLSGMGLVRTVAEQLEVEEDAVQEVYWWMLNKFCGDRRVRVRTEPTPKA